MSRLGVINTIHLYWHFVVGLRDTQTPPLSVTLKALAVINRKPRYWILVEDRDFCPGYGVAVGILP